MRDQIEKLSQAGLEFEGEPRIIVCQGPPVCDLKGDAAVKAAENGCPWCKRITLHDDMTETVIEPTNQ